MQWVEKIVATSVKIISIADTVGLAESSQVSSVMNALIPKYPDIELGVHLHSTQHNWKEKVDAALHSGCTRFDGALKGIGGCPLADDELVGNMDTELLIPYLEELSLLEGINKYYLAESVDIAERIFKSMD
jgi:hydroxymethylglutaryl-CoA lyase